MATLDCSLCMFNGKTDIINKLYSTVQDLSISFNSLGKVIDNTTDKMMNFITSIQKTPAISENFKAPFDNAIKGVANIALNPENFNKLVGKPQYIALSLAIGVVWEVLGDDIITLLTPALNIAAAALGFISDNMETLTPIIWGVIAALFVYKAITMASTAGIVAYNIALMAKSIAMGIVALTTGNATLAQTALNTAMAASPIGWLMLAVGGLTVLIYKWIKSVGGIKIAWMIVCNAIQDAVGALKIEKKTIDSICHKCYICNQMGGGANGNKKLFRRGRTEA